MLPGLPSQSSFISVFARTRSAPVSDFTGSVVSGAVPTLAPDLGATAGSSAPPAGPAPSGIRTPVLALVRAPGFLPGPVRLALPLILLVGIGALAGAGLLSRPRRPTHPGAPS